MFNILIIFVMTILMVVDRVAPESKNNSVLFPSLTYTESFNERNIVMPTEQWKPINGYEGIYEISNLGNVKSCKRYITDTIGRKRPVGGTIFKPYNSRGYLCVALSKDHTQKTCFIHRLVWDAFGDNPRDGRKLQVDHINHNKLDNKIDNLQLLTARENNHKATLLTGKELPIGVSWHKGQNKYTAHIYKDKKPIWLGTFDNVESAQKAYNNAKMGS